MPDASVPIEAFSNAVAVALAEMAGVEMVLLEWSEISGPHEVEGISAILTPTLSSDGMLFLSMSESAAAALAGRILAAADIHEPDTTMIRDCIGEVANIVAGQAKTNLYGTPWHFSFSAPWPEVPKTLTFKNALRLQFKCDVGDLLLIADLPE